LLIIISKGLERTVFYSFIRSKYFDPEHDLTQRTRDSFVQGFCEFFAMKRLNCMFLLLLLLLLLPLLRLALLRSSFDSPWQSPWFMVRFLTDYFTPL
jgi:hypothetical protein